MHIVLVNAPPYKIQESYYDTPPYPRTGLAYLAGSLRAAGIGVSVVDCKYERLNHVQALEKICDMRADLVGFTAFSNEVIQAAALARDLKNCHPEVYTVIGGVHATILPEQTLLEFPQFDFVIMGEGERAIVELVRALKGHENPLTISGVAGIDANGIYRNGGEREPTVCLDDLAPPAWDIFPPAREYILHTQRGCPFHCPFCVNPNGRRVRAESIDRVMVQLEELTRTTPVRSVLFGDEVFTINRKRTIAFCKEFIRRDFHKKIQWWCLTHINCIDYELACLMREAGCFRVGLGIESGDEERLRFINKGTNVRKILGAVSALKKAKLPFESYFILGQPNETLRSAKSTLDFAVKINADYPVFGIMVPYPGTKINQMAGNNEAGYRLIAKDWNDYNKQIGGAMEFVGVGRKELEKLQLKGYILVFLKNYRFVDFLRMAWTYRTLAYTLLKNILTQRNTTA